MITIKAVEDKIFVEEMIISEESAGGIVLATDSTQLPQSYGKVLSVGEKAKDLVKVGDTVVFHQKGGQALFMNHKNYRILMINELYGIIDIVKEKKNE